MAVRELTETELEVFEEELAAAAQTLESREERMQEVLSRITNINLILFTSGFPRSGGSTDVAWSNGGGGQVAGRRRTNHCCAQ